MTDQLSKGTDEIKNWLKGKKAVQTVTKLPGDASTRMYYRVEAEGRSFIVMKMEDFTQHGHNLPFLVIQKHLFEAGVDVPRVFDTEASKGFMLLEDLGDITLLRRLQEVSNADTERHLYERVLDSLVHLQVHASPARKPAPIEAYKLRFDYDKLMWEINFTIEHFYQKHLRRQIADKDKQIMAEGFGEICAVLAAQPTVLAHRDFHSRNIMITPHAGASSKDTERLVMIDFQDARMGPAQYDLASLLKDSYYQLEEKQTERLLDYYIARYEAVSGDTLDRAKFLQVFDLMSIQRNFKAIGSFASFLNRRGNPTYLKFIGNTFENIRRTLLKYPKYSALREVLFHYYYF